MRSSLLFDKFPIPHAQSNIQKNKSVATSSIVISASDECIIKSSKKSRKSSCLTSNLLLSEDGLQKVYNDFPLRCKFRGRGYERNDLKNMMSAYREWAWLLNPGSSHCDFLNKCEILGSTQEIKSKLLQMREKERTRFIHHQKAFPVLPKKKVKFNDKPEII
jgi:hypothetical protein